MKRSYIHYRAVIITVLLTFAIMLVLLYAPSPFVVTKPGIAVPTNSYIQLAVSSQPPSGSSGQGQQGANGEGELLLTAVMLETPSIWKSLGALFAPSKDVKLKRDVLGGASLEEYVEHVTTIMQNSHHNALEAAYRYLQIPYSIEPQAVIVQQSKSRILSVAALKAGDKIVAGVHADGERTSINSIEQLAQWLRLLEGQKQAALVIERDQAERQLEISLAKIDKALSDERLATEVLDVASFIEQRAVIPEDERYKLEIATDNIGGPSAGLVLALTIIDKLTEGDLTKGKRIAVTGTINAEGKVGSIGGVVQKVYATSKQGAHLFIVPKGNEQEAKRTVKRIGSKMEIAGVSSLEEAIAIISSLQ